MTAHDRTSDPKETSIIRRDALMLGASAAAISALGLKSAPAHAADITNSRIPLITGITRSIEEALAAVPAGHGFMVLNLFKFNEIANYQNDENGEKISGQDAYWKRYIPALAPITIPAGVKLRMRAPTYPSLASLPNTEWDEMAIFSWPNVGTMIDLSQHPVFLKESVHRIAALQNLRMVPMPIVLGDWD